MKRKTLLGFLTCVMILTLSLPFPTMASNETSSSQYVEFNAGGMITSISDGVVDPAGNSGRWRVIEREISGQIAGSISGQYTLNYQANIESVLTQSGKMQGVLSVCDVDGIYNLNIEGHIQPLVYDPEVPIPPYLAINGDWEFVDGSKGKGTFSAGVWFIPDEQGHVALILGSYFVMTGSWVQP